jgi:alpha-tubulin suppressor-like RCC1 family protein
MLCTKTDGTLWTWGEGGSGELGLGGLTNRSSPVQIGSLTNWSVPTVAASWSLCTKTDGTLWAWGDNRHGCLGLGTAYLYPVNTRRSSPTQVGSLTNWAIPFNTNGSQSGCLKTDGTLWVWGRNLNGSSGLGDTVERSSPVQVGTLTTWTLPGPFGQVNSCLQTP